MGIIKGVFKFRFCRQINHLNELIKKASHSFTIFRWFSFLIGALNFKETVASEQINAFGTRKRDKTKTNKQSIPSKAKRINNEPKKKKWFRTAFRKCSKKYDSHKVRSNLSPQIKKHKKGIKKIPLFLPLSSPQKAPSDIDECKKNSAAF